MLRLVPLLAALLCAAPAPAAPPPAAVSDALRAPRPRGGEFLGLYLMDKKVGYLFSDLALVPGRPGEARSRTELVFKAQVGTKTSERRHREDRVYESRPGGRLLSFVIIQEGDGGAQRLEGTAGRKALTVVRKRPGMPDETLSLAPSEERIEDADPARVALLRRVTVQGHTTDAQDLGSYRVVTTVAAGKEAFVERTVGGVKVKLGRAVTLSDKEKVPVESYIASSGEMVEVAFGTTMRARGEPESVAKRLDQVEVFGLTRIVLPRPLASQARAIPGAVSLVVEGLPEKFQKNTARQTYRALAGGRTEVKLTAATPSLAGRKSLPLGDPDGGENLRTSIIIESDNPRIQAIAHEVVGSERDAYLAAKKIVTWVATRLQKDYGASADRATDVLRQMKGDCTEHSLLTVSLLRASGIPARRIDGVVYLLNDDGVPALYWHEWVEAFVGEWTQMDPTFNQLVADATHFALGQEGNAEITPLIGQLKVVEVR